MTSESRTVVFDTGPLRHFALSGWLGVLKFLNQGTQVIIPESVEVELLDQRHSYASLQQIFDADWIAVDRSDDIKYLSEFARFEQRLVAGDQNRGECGVLALGKVRGHSLVLDDGAPRRIAKEEKIPFTGTLGLLCEAIRENQLKVSMVESLADDLLIGTYFLPFKRGGFREWAETEGLID